MLFSQDKTNVFEYGLMAEQTIGATMDSRRIAPFFSSLSIFSYW